MPDSTRDPAHDLLAGFQTAAPQHPFLGWPVVTDPGQWQADVAMLGIPRSEPYAGDEQECFPAALRFRLAPDGTLSEQPAEPIAAEECCSSAITKCGYSRSSCRTLPSAPQRR